MISLTHFKKCPSVLSIPKEIDLNSSLNFCTDTRKYQHPSFFVAIPGIKVNPLDVIENLLSQKCPLIVFQDDLINQSTEISTNVNIFGFSLDLSLIIKYIEIGFLLYYIYQKH